MNKKAFSLVEMLVAVLLITLLIGVAIFSFRHQLLIINKSETSGLSKVIDFNQLRTSIESMKYYVVDEYDSFNNPLKDLHYFFKGNEKKMEYITKNPLFSDEIALVNLICEDSKLVYIEEALYGRINFLSPKVLEDSKEKVFFNELEECKFNYYSDKKVFNELSRQIPLSININLSFKNKKEIMNLYISIKSDDNTTFGRVYEAVYPVK